MLPTRDWLAKTPAIQLAQQIEDYWAKQGKKVRTTVEEHKTQYGKFFYSITSDMVNGLPKN